MRYPGFDWNSITNTDYPYEDSAQVTSSNSNFWNQECVVEILTPRNRTTDSVYYEIGPRIPVGARRRLMVIMDLSLISHKRRIFRPVLISTNEYDSGGNTWGSDPKDRIIKSS